MSKRLEVSSKIDSNIERTSYVSQPPLTKIKTTLASSCGMRSNGAHGVLEHARVLGNATNDDPFARASERGAETRSPTVK